MEIPYQELQKEPATLLKANCKMPIAKINVLRRQSRKVKQSHAEFEN